MTEYASVWRFPMQRYRSVILWCETCLSLYKGHLDELQKAEIVSKSELVPSVSIKTHCLKLITGNKSYNSGGRYRQVSM